MWFRAFLYYTDYIYRQHYPVSQRFFRHAQDYKSEIKNMNGKENRKRRNARDNAVKATFLYFLNAHYAADRIYMGSAALFRSFLGLPARWSSCWLKNAQLVDYIAKPLYSIWSKINTDLLSSCFKDLYTSIKELFEAQLCSRLTSQQ